MDSVEFAKNIDNNADLFIKYFDSTMALYNLVHTFSGLKIVNNCSEAEIRFDVEGEVKDLQAALNFINNYQVSGYGIFNCRAYMEVNHMVIILTQVG